MQFTIYDLYSFSIAIAAVIAIVRYKRIYPGFRPFLFICWTALLTEIVCYFLIYRGNSTEIPFGIYSLVESLLLLWLFRELGVFEQRRSLFFALVGLYIAGWAVEAIFFDSFSRNMTWFRLGYSFIVVLLGIIVLGKELSVQRTFLLKSPVFLICIAFLLYYSCAVIAGVFELDGTNLGIRRQLQAISIYVNLFVNLIYAVAVLCMPRYLRYSLPY